MILLFAALVAPNALRRSSALQSARAFAAKRLSTRPPSALHAARAPAVKRLSIDEEVALSTLAQQEQTLQRARADLARRLGRTPTGEEWAFAALNASARELGALRREARAAKDALVRANAGLVVAVARGYQSGRRDVPLDDLIQEGTLGLIRAAEKFDGARGVRFSTYATTWIRSAISSYLRTTIDPIRVPQRVRLLAARSRRAGEELEISLGRTATDLELETELGADAPAATSAAARVAGARVVSADALQGLDLGDVAADESKPRGDLAVALSDALAETLSERDLRVVRLRYGLDDGTVRSTRECAALLGIGKESVRQICLRAFRTLRGTAHGAALLDYMD